MIQEIVLITTVTLMAVVTFAFLYVAINSKYKTAEYAAVQLKSYGIRSKFFWLLTVCGIIITVVTTLDLPYAVNRGGVPEDAVVVNIEGRQWAWIMDQNEAQVGESVVFNVTAADVTHGLGIYDPQMRLMGQTQAMPGYTNSLKMTFDEPGTYTLLCMEYCGLAHHKMISEFIIKDKSGEIQ